MPSPIARHLTGAASALWLLAGPSFGHGAFLDVSEGAAILVEGRYDTGEVMSGAQVTIYAPDDPARPWQTGEADAEGRFVFLPDDRAGQWAIQMRQAGHGAMGYVEIGEGGGSVILTPPAASGQTRGQRVIMAAGVIWGFVGTALFFRRPRQTERGERAA